MKEGFGYFERRRKALTALFIIIGIGFVLISRHSWVHGGTLDVFFDVAGVLLVAIGVLGRLWSTAYIGGRKNKELVVKGPYSMTRNPLYLFSFIAGLGVCIEMENLYLIIAYIVVFLVSYHFVIKSEEKRLEVIFGREFEEYRRRTPAFFPNPFKLDVGVLGSVAPGLIKKSIRDGSVFVLLLIVAWMIEVLHDSGMMYTILSVP